MQGKITNGDEEVVIKETDTAIVLKIDPKTGDGAHLLNGEVAHMVLMLARLLNDEPGIAIKLAMAMRAMRATLVSKCAAAEKEGEKHVH